MGLRSYIQEMFNSGDPLLRSWSLVKDSRTPFLLCGLYLLLVLRIIPSIMHNRKPMELRNIMIAYNFIIVLSYLYLIVRGVGIIFGSDCMTFLCKDFTIGKDLCTYEAAVLGWYAYVLKYIEFGDTIFSALRKKDHHITKLHLFHHTAFPLIFWTYFRVERTGFHSLSGFLNCFIHVIMYTYYGLTAMGPSVQIYLWWKKYLTIIQITQFVVILMYTFVYGPYIGCKTTYLGSAANGTFVAVIFILFYNFYYKTYIITDESKTKTKNRGILNYINHTIDRIQSEL